MPANGISEIHVFKLELQYVTANYLNFRDAC